MTDKLIISDLEFFGHCGITEEERKTGQRLSINLEIGYDSASAAKNDRLEDALDYAAISKRLVEIGGKESFRLIESLAEKMVSVLAKEFSAREVRFRLKKLHPPVDPMMKYAAVEIHRVF